MAARNVSDWLAVTAEKYPDRAAVIAPVRRFRNSARFAPQVSWTFAQLREQTDRYAFGLAQQGLRRATRVLVMLRPGFDFVSVAFALLKIGAVPVFIDPGMGLRALKQCILDVRPTAFIAIAPAFVFSLLLPEAFATVKKKIVVGGRAAAAVLGGTSLARIARLPRPPCAPVEVSENDEALIAFTSGSTGIPKGVVFTHPMLQSIVDVLRSEIGIQEKEVDLPALPVFALFNPALGVTTVIPDMDPARAARADAGRLVRQIQVNRVTTSFGSPTIWKKVAAYCLRHNLQLHGVRRILMAGAPVPLDLLGQFGPLLPDGKVLTPYGATEAISLTCISGDEILKEADDHDYPCRGVCVGRPFAGISLQTVAITDDDIRQWDDIDVLPPGEPGEIVAGGPVVTRTYVNRPSETRHAKIYHQNSVLHRTGDLGYIDRQGRLWLCGRKSHRVETTEGLLLPVPCEAVFNRHPGVARTALVGLGPPGRQRPVLIAELKPGIRSDRRRIADELRALGARHAHTKHVSDILFHPRFPVDVRHNAKIRREKLRQWAQRHARGCL